MARERQTKMGEYDLGYDLNLQTLESFGIRVTDADGSSAEKKGGRFAVYPAANRARTAWRHDALPALPRAVEVSAAGSGVFAGSARTATVFDEGAPLPCRKTLVLSVPAGWGEEELPLSCGDLCVGVCHVGRINPPRAGEREVELIFELDLRGNFRAKGRMLHSRDWVRVELPDTLRRAARPCAA